MIGLESSGLGRSERRVVEGRVGRVGRVGRKGVFLSSLESIIETEELPIGGVARAKSGGLESGGTRLREKSGVGE